MRSGVRLPVRIVPFKRMRQSEGFTLIELLVVIAIIAIVAAILFPVFASAKGAAKRTTALDNLNQIGIAAHLYLNDYDDTLPWRFPNESKWLGYGAVLFISGPGLTDKFEPYIKNNDVWFSPEDRLNPRGTSSFCMNEQLAFSWPMSSFSRPAEAIYFTDRTDIPQTKPTVDTYVWWMFTDQEPFSEASLPGVIDPVSVAEQIDPIRYTGNLAIYLFLDSHCKAMPFAQTWGNASTNLHLATKS